MLNSDEADIEIFFDSADFLPPQHSVLDEELGSSKFGYEVWVNRPQSVKERRQRFFQEMGFVDFSSNLCSQEINALELERIMESEGAASSAFSSSPEENVLFDERNGDANFERKVCESSSSGKEHRPGEAEASEECQYGPFDMGKKKMKGWWKLFVKSRKTIGGKVRSKLKREMSKTRRINVKQNKKRWMELSALYLGQEIRAHEGLIWTMKFSPNGQYVASGGEDGVVRVWRIISMDTSSICFDAEDINSTSKVKQEISCSWRKKSNISFMALPNKVLQIEESPLQEFFGHISDVLDLAWSDSNILLSSSMDKTVRLWQIGCDQCMGVFRHSDYVTCIQANPVDKNYFISGSIDGKVRIWGLREKRVVDWADVRDVITAISYHPDGKGFVVGSITGACRFYVASGKHFQLEAEIWVHGKKRSAGNKITGIQFSQKKHQRVMITSEDSKIRVLDGFELVQKFKGIPKSGSQTCGSFTSTENHIISVGEDSHVCIWNCNGLEHSSSKAIKSQRCCEYFSTEGVTVAIPWLVNSTEHASLCGNSEMQHLQEARPSVRDSERFSLGNWFTMEGTCRGSVTWPEEKLPTWNFPFAEDEYDPIELCNRDAWHERVGSETWGLSFVVAGLDGTIKTFHNFGLPVRL
ncbi:uncharacterized protein LOC114723953 [Neltuma alba]|uniref:uncharacterized protein LOC114723953 n=1 Tax=Neltuma alba TaxID=207710 RepID=UPI0010A3CC54|nr:uncharacterized protein LOC114723953 [Prosopis alba]